MQIIATIDIHGAHVTVMNTVNLFTKLIEYMILAGGKIH